MRACMNYKELPASQFGIARVTKKKTIRFYVPITIFCVIFLRVATAERAAR